MRQRNAPKANSLNVSLELSPYFFVKLRSSCSLAIEPDYGAEVPCAVSLIGSLRTWARRLKRDLTALYLAAGDPRVPWYAKAVAGAVVAYALSPIDLIPDFIPVLGHIDDLILVPLGIALAIRLVPWNLMEEFRRSAERQPPLRRRALAGAVVIVGIWLVLTTLLGRWVVDKPAWAP